MTETGEFLTTFIVNSLWQIPLIAATAALCSRLMQSVPSVYRHLVWVAALGLCIYLPAGSLWSSNRVGHNFSAASSQVSEADNGDRDILRVLVLPEERTETRLSSIEIQECRGPHFLFPQKF